MNIETFYRHVAAGSRALSIANGLGHPHQGKALAAYNRARSRLRHAQKGTQPAKQYPVDIETTVRGIPCGVHIASYQPHACGKRGHIDDWHPDDQEEVDFILTDLGGYEAAHWLKPTVTDMERLQCLCLDYARHW